MIQTLLLLCIALASSCFAIVGGEAVNKGEYQSVVALVRLGRPFCTGVALTPTHILTAAHCLENKNYKSIRIYTGAGKIMTAASSKENLDAQYSVTGVELHPSLKFKYPNGPLADLASLKTVDLAILTTDSPLRVKKFYSLLTDPKEILDKIAPGKLTTAVGFGYTGEIGFMPMDTAHAHIIYGQKRMAIIPIFEVFFNEIDMRNKQTDTCYIDSGGPVFVDVNGELKIAAIVSASFGFCAEGKYATLYSLAYHSVCWIKKVTGISDEHSGFHCGRNIKIAQECYGIKNEEDLRSCADKYSDEILRSYP
ncbi:MULTISPECIES: S1 family peptidase [unclassified Halobacteriovorax]|uniref:S1 family peptidase n=1 Tax=unclassified Halobacteriovorax TaxID=2639665 RepID=UPI00399AAD23